MSEINQVDGPHPNPEIPSRDVPPSASPNPAFSRIMNDAMSAAELPEAPLLPSATEIFNARNLLNGQFPPPDSGAGYTSTHISLQDEEAA